jgi:hypothetical protein
MHDLERLLAQLTTKIRGVFGATSKQVIDLRQALERFSQTVQGRYIGTRSAELVARL